MYVAISSDAATAIVFLDIVIVAAAVATAVVDVFISTI